MNSEDQSKWMDEHIPHRVRAAIAQSDFEDSLLRVKTFITPERRTAEDNINWRCSTDSIWEGRLAATRWLIEFVGIRQKRGEPAEKSSRGSDVRIDDFDGGRLVVPLTPQGRCLAKFWKGCSQASSHATNAYDHDSVDEKELADVLKIILEHLQNTIYKKAGKHIRDYVLALHGAL